LQITQDSRHDPLRANGYTPDQEQEKKEDYKFIHCPECLTEYPFTKKLLGKQCPNCGPPRPKYIPTVRSIKDQGAEERKTSSWSVAFIVFLITVILAEGGILAWAYYQRTCKKAPLSPTLLRCQCPMCHRKIGYSIRIANTGFLCPQCKTGFVLPGLEENEAGREGVIL
jgi:hypothetical protein